MRSWFLGRTNRTTYFLSLVSISCIFPFLNFISHYPIENIFIKLIVVFSMLALAVTLFIGLIALEVRRWHDIGKSGWFAVLNFIPIVGQVITITLFFIPGDSQKNKYGKPPVSIRF